MISSELLIVGAAVGGAIGGALAVLAYQRVRAWLTGDSRRAHERAQDRAPPIELGETYEVGITDFTDHHSGERIAVGKAEGFVLFTEDVPKSVSEGDVIRAKVLSFNEGRTSADATHVDD